MSTATETTRPDEERLVFSTLARFSLLAFAKECLECVWRRFTLVGAAYFFLEHTHTKLSKSCMLNNRLLLLLR
uniref:Uncharacterized protein n=1 Tax=Romanomermis culicivorax TaxID=13658 RepID=A0A915L9P6_ROMCU